MSKKAIPCEQCGEIVYRFPSQVKRHVFCGRKCCGEWNWARGNVNLAPPRYGMFNNQYRGGKVKVQCGQCGKEIERYPSRVARGTTLFCSLSCRGQWYSENYSGENSSQWREGVSWHYIRKQALERDGDKCKVCGWTLGLEVHHLMPRSLGGTNDLENLVTLCPNHHTEIHALGRQGFLEAYQDIA